jgi:hypothetical protein
MNEPLPTSRGFATVPPYDYMHYAIDADVHQRRDLSWSYRAVGDERGRLHALLRSPWGVRIQFHIKRIINVRE